MNITHNKLNLNKTEIYKYLEIEGNQSIEALDQTIDQMIQEIKRVSNSQYNYKVYKTFTIQEATINLNNGEFIIKSRDLAQHLHGSQKIIVMAVTAGTAVDHLIKKNLVKDASKGLITDAVASTFVEALADASCEKIVDEYGNDRNFRYAPGYGDLSLTVQSDILQTLKADKTIGLYANNSHMLVPSKSITGIFGLFDQPIHKNKSCNNCHVVNDCSYRKRGVRCYD